MGTGSLSREEFDKEGGFDGTVKLENLAASKTKKPPKEDMLLYVKLKLPGGPGATAVVRAPAAEVSSAQEL